MHIVGARLVVIQTRSVQRQIVAFIKAIDPNLYWSQIHEWPPGVGFSSVPPEE
jgi:hypothetical protein